MSSTHVRWPACPVPLDRTSAFERAVDAAVAARLGHLSLEHKIGQMIQAEISHATPAETGEFALGSMLNGGGSSPGGNKHASADDWLALADAYFAASSNDGAPDLAIPILWGTDAVHGHSNVYRATVFAHNVGLGAARDSELVEAIGEATAREVAATGIDWTFAPTLAVVRDDRWGRTYEGYSEHPDVVADYAPRMVTGLQGRVGDGSFLGPYRVLATSKHFLGEGTTAGGRDQGDATCTETILRDVHAAGHLAAISAGAQVVMAAYNSWQGVKVHGHRYLLTDVLKDALQFDGFVVSDWNGYQQTASDHADACACAVNAGVDMLMVGEDWRRVYSDLLQQVVAGRVPMVRIDDAVARILRVKGRAGLFAAKPPSARPGAGGATALGCPQHRRLARRAVRESLVMLKNDTGLLPLGRDLKVLVAGDGAHDIGKQCGGWTLTWQGTGNRNEDFPNGNSVFDGIVEAVADHGSVALRPDGDFADDDAPDVAIVVFGENPYAEGDGDRAHLSYSAEHPQPVAILRRLKARGVSTVAVFLTGRPMWVNPELNASDAFVVAWLPGTEGGGVADVLFRGAGGRMDHDFRGTLSFSWPGHALHTPLNVGDADYAPLFPYGFGLRYADPATRLPKRPEQDTASGLPVENLPRRASSTYPR